MGLILGFHCSLNAQKWKMEAYASGGSIWKHSKKISFDTDVFCPSVTLHLRRNPDVLPRKWDQKYPGWKAGYSFSYRYLGEDYLGSAFGIYATIEKLIFETDLVALSFQVGSGLAYITEVFDPENNTTRNNDALSTGFNNISNFNLRSKWHLSENYSLLLGGEFTHYSNGGYSLPNLGINVVSGNLGISARLNNTKNHYVPERIDRWRMFLGTRFSRLEWPEQGVGRRSLVNAHMGVKYIRNDRAHWIASVEYELNYALYWHGLDEGIFDNEEDAYRQSYRWIISLGREFVFDQWSILIQSGLNLRDDIKIPPPKRIANVLGIKRYFLAEGPISPYIGLYMKSHGSVAEYFGMGVGADFF